MVIADAKGVCVFCKERFECSQVMLWRITRSRVTMPLSSGSEGLKWIRSCAGAEPGMVGVIR